MALPELPEVARLMMARIGPKALAAAEKLLDDPNLNGRDKLTVVKLIMDRYVPIPKVDSAGDRRPNQTINLNAAGDLTQLLARAQARIEAKPIELTAEPIDVEREPIADSDEGGPGPDHLDRTVREAGRSDRIESYADRARGP
jgi:hypothetical protein